MSAGGHRLGGSDADRDAGIRAEAVRRWTAANVPGIIAQAKREGAADERARLRVLAGRQDWPQEFEEEVRAILAEPLAGSGGGR